MTLADYGRWVTWGPTRLLTAVTRLTVGAVLISGLIALGSLIGGGDRAETVFARFNQPAVPAAAPGQPKLAVVAVDRASSQNEASETATEEAAGSGAGFVCRVACQAGTIDPIGYAVRRDVPAQPGELPEDAAARLTLEAPALCGKTGGKPAAGSIPSCAFAHPQPIDG